MSEGRTVLITGLSSFAARYLLTTLLKQEPESTFYAIVPERLLDRVLGDLEMDPAATENLHLLTGDTVALDLGLSGTEYTELTEAVTDIYHMASIFYLGVDVDEARRVNVQGTQNALRFASECVNLRRFNHFSTAFVAGDRKGVIMEDELDVGQSFRNPFERTKYEAELALKPWRGRLPITVYRPSLIVGHSETGEIDRNRMEGPYVLMKAIINAPGELAIPLPGKGDKPLNMVPIDWVCQTMAELSRHPEAEGKVFHLTDPNPLSAREVFDLVARHADRKAPRGRVPYRLTRLVLKLPFLERLARRHRQFLDDFNQLTIFNSLNTARLVSASCPPFTEYAEPLVRFMLAEMETGV